MCHYIAHSIGTNILYKPAASAIRVNADKGGILQNTDKKFPLEQAMRLPKGEKKYSSTFS
jgi:hypothetical protein